METTRKPSIFDEQAAIWDENPGRWATARAVVEAIRAAVPLNAGWAALDYGAGTGLVTLGLVPCVARVTAVDSSRNMLAVLAGKAAAQGLTTVRTQQADLAAAPWDGERFDLVVSSMALHHIADTGLLLRRLRAALQPGGWVALADLDREDGTFHPDPTGVHHRGFDRDALRAALANAGYTGVAFRDAHRIRKPGADGVERTYGVFLATALAVNRREEQGMNLETADERR